ncbi:OmpW family outer membrane protein [uncultured Sphaerotilus sp.]|uniref:OmpW/AlkL family protein n=1 Tax=uncultured Sphaerotilus sp. TaxID=474984 RepID=UPI0030CA50CD
MNPFKTNPVLRSACLLALAATLTGTPARAQDASPWAVRLGAAHVGFSTRADVQAGGAPVPGADASASSNTTPGLELSYALSPQWTGRFLIGVPPTTTLTGTGTLASAGTLGKVTYGPAVLSATYSPWTTGPVRPYVGAGLNYTIVFRSEDGFISPLDVKNGLGAVLQVGVEIPLDGGWSVGLDARKIYVKTQADGRLPAMGGAVAHADVRLDPLVVFLSVGRRF